MLSHISSLHSHSLLTGNPKFLEPSLLDALYRAIVLGFDDICYGGRLQAGHLPSLLRSLQLGIPHSPVPSLENAPCLLLTPCHCSQRRRHLPWTSTCKSSPVIPWPFGRWQLPPTKLTRRSPPQDYSIASTLNCEVFGSGLPKKKVHLWWYK